LPRLLVLLVLGCIAGIAVVRINLETWVWKAIQTRLAEGPELRAEVGGLRVRLADLTVEFTDLQLEPLDPGMGRLRVEVAYGRARLPWRALIGLGRGSVHLAELRLVRPHVWTDEDFFKRSRRGRRPARRLPIDLFLDRAEIVSGSWFHERTVKELELSASELFLVGNWAGDRRTMLGELGLSLRVHGDPLERDATVRIDSTFRWRGTNFELIRTHARGAGIELDADIELALDRTPILSGRGSFTADVNVLDQHMQQSRVRARPGATVDHRGDRRAGSGRRPILRRSGPCTRGVRARVGDFQRDRSLDVRR